VLNCAIVAQFVTEVMYNAGTQVQVLKDVELGSCYLKYFFEGISPITFVAKKRCQILHNSSYWEKNVERHLTHNINNILCVYNFI
jgi:hypothetical protein